MNLLQCDFYDCKKRYCCNKSSFMQGKILFGSKEYVNVVFVKFKCYEKEKYDKRSYYYFPYSLSQENTNSRVQIFNWGIRSDG